MSCHRGAGVMCVWAEKGMHVFGRRPHVSRRRSTRARLPGSLQRWGSTHQALALNPSCGRCRRSQIRAAPAVMQMVMASLKPFHASLASVCDRVLTSSWRMPQLPWTWKTGLQVLLLKASQLWIKWTKAESRSKLLDLERSKPAAARTIQLVDMPRMLRLLQLAPVCVGSHP